MRMKWSNENFMRQCEIADKKLEYERELTLLDEYALNLRDCRDMYSRLENYGKTQFCLGCERHARRVAELEAHLKAAMSLLIDWQATANGSTHERATLAAKVSDWLKQTAAAAAEMQKANARLIAAAPDLLEALKQMDRQVMDLTAAIDLDDRTTAHACLDRLRAIQQAAIRKAEEGK